MGVSVLRHTHLLGICKRMTTIKLRGASDALCPAFKLVRLRKNGTLGPLFINRKQVIPVGVWLKAKRHPTKGYAVRRGWHVTRRPRAPHLSTKGRIWVAVEVTDFKELPRPDAQGGLWLIAQWMRVLPPPLDGRQANIPAALEYCDQIIQSNYGGRL